ncbi:hypothetical protein ABC795_09280 [Blastococcus sp. HT6-30]
MGDLVLDEDGHRVTRRWVTGPTHRGGMQSLPPFSRLSPLRSRDHGVGS